MAGDGSDVDNDGGFRDMARRNDQVEGRQSNSVDDGSFNNQAGVEGGGMADRHECSSVRNLGEFQGFREDVRWLFLYLYAFFIEKSEVIHGRLFGGENGA